MTNLSQFAFDLCDSQLIFFSCVSSVENVSQALFRASHKYHLVFLPCLLSSLMAVRCNQRQTNSFLQSLAYMVSGIMDMQVPEFQTAASIGKTFATIVFVLFLIAISN